MAFLAACGGERKKKFVGTRCCIPQMRGPTPRQRTSSSALLVSNSILALLVSRNKKADKTFVDRDEVASMLRGTTHFEPALRYVAHYEVRNIHVCLSSTWFVR
jgi:hypothetical protein